MSYPVGRSSVCQIMLVFATVLALWMQAALLMGWGLAASVGSGAWFASGLLWLVCLGWAWYSWHQMVVGWLSWAPEEGGPLGHHGVGPKVNGVVVATTGWWWSDVQGAVGRPIVRIQPAMVFNRWMLLRVTFDSAAGGVVWMWLESRALPVRWPAWQRAVLAHGR